MFLSHFEIDFENDKKRELIGKIKIKIAFVLFFTWFLIFNFQSIYGFLQQILSQALA